MSDQEVAPEGAAETVRVDELAQVREVVLRAHPDAVPEMIAGSSIGELLASVEPARAAYSRISAQFAAPAQTPPAVPAGSVAAAVDPASLPAHELIRRGIARTRRTGE
jgi:hypothetical protein